MDIEGMVIEVSGLPDSYPSGFMIDKLIMHFLRRSNNGGDVLTVIYPTSSKGRAYVVFELPEVLPGVLQHSHVLEVDGQFYPLDIKKGYHPQLDMPVEAWLDVNVFSRQREVKTLLQRYGFMVSETSSGQLHLQGSFLKLKAIRPKLMQIVAQEPHIQFPKTSSPHINGYSNGSVSKSSLSGLESIHDSTPRHSHISGNSVYVRARSPSAVAPLGSPEFQKNLPLPRNDSLSEGGYSIHGSFSSPTQIYESLKTSSNHHSLRSPRRTETSFPVEPDVFRYAMCFKKDVIETIESDHSTQIKQEGNSDIVTIKLLGGACDEAAKELSRLMQRITLSLRTQEIDLNELDSSQQKLISQNVDMYQKVYKVLMTQEAGVLKVVGSSNDSYDAKQMLLGLKSNISVPSHLKKNSLLRRSSSLPRQTTKTRREELDVRRSPETVLQSSAVGNYSSSHYQTDSKQAVPQERGRQLSKSTVQRSRAQSASGSAHKNQKLENKLRPPLDQHDLSTPIGDWTSNKGQSPTIFHSLFPGNIKSISKLKYKINK